MLGRTPVEHEDQGVAEIPSPERAASALAHLCRYSEWRHRPKVSSDQVTVIEQASVVREIVSNQLAEAPSGGWLELDVAARLLSSCGLPVLSTQAVFNADKAATTAESARFSRRAQSPLGRLVHKSTLAAS